MMKNLTLMMQIKLLNKEEMREQKKEIKRKNKLKTKRVQLEAEKPLKKLKRTRTNMSKLLNHFNILNV